MYIGKLQLRGIPIRRQPAFVATKFDDASIREYGFRPLEYQNDLISDAFIASEYVQYLVSRQKDLKGLVTMELKNIYPDIVYMDLLSKISITEPETSVNSSFYVEALEHTIRFDVAVEHTVSYTLRLAEAKSFLILDRPEEGKLDASRTLGF